MGVIIADLLVVIIFSDQPEDQAEVLISKDRSKDQGVMQISRDRNRDLGVVRMPKDHNKDQGVMLISKDHNKGRAAVQISVNQKEARTQGNHIIVLQGIQVLESPQEVLRSGNPIVIDLVSNDPQTDPEVLIQEVREVQAIIKEEEIEFFEFCA